MNIFEVDEKEREEKKLEEDNRYQPRKSEHPVIPTSLDANAVIKPLKRVIQNEVLNYIKTHPDCTQESAHEYFSQYGFMDEDLRRKYLNKEYAYATIRSRYTELQRMGLIKVSGKRLIKNGAMCNSYVVTGRTEPLLFNVKATYKEKLGHLIYFLMEELGKTTDIDFKVRIENALTTIGYIPEEQEE